MSDTANPATATSARASGDALLQLDGIETCYGLSQVLFKLSLAIAPGEMVTLMGRNGMGKTTTIRSILGLTQARAGSIRFRGKEIREFPSYRIAQLGLGLVPEGRQIFPNLNVRENLVATAANRGKADDPWTLLAYSCGDPITIFGEWHGDSLAALAVLGAPAAVTA